MRRSHGEQAPDALRLAQAGPDVGLPEHPGNPSVYSRKRLRIGVGAFHLRLRCRIDGHVVVMRTGVETDGFARRHPVSVAEQSGEVSAGFEAPSFRDPPHDAAPSGMVRELRKGPFQPPVENVPIDATYRLEIPLDCRPGGSERVDKRRDTQPGLSQMAVKMALHRVGTRLRDSFFCRAVECAGQQPPEHTDERRFQSRCFAVRSLRHLSVE